MKTRISKNLLKIHSLLFKNGYKQYGNWFIDGDFKIKFNKNSITMKGQRGTQLSYINPNTISLNDLCNLIQYSMT